MSHQINTVVTALSRLLSWVWTDGICLPVVELARLAIMGLVCELLLTFSTRIFFGLQKSRIYVQDSKNSPTKKTSEAQVHIYDPKNAQKKANNHARRTPNQVRSKRRVEKIVLAAQSLFAQRGFNATTTNDIADLAGVSIGSLYQFFPNKIAILSKLDEIQANKFKEQLTKTLPIAIAHDPLEIIIEQVIELLRQHHEEEHGVLHVIHQSAREGLLHSKFLEIHNQVSEYLEKLLSLRIPQVSKSERIIIARVCLLVTDALFMDTISQSPQVATRLIQEIKTVLLRYLEPVFKL